MTKQRLSILMLAAVTLLCLGACGRTTVDSSTPEGLQTFGAQVEPSAQPSTGQTVNGTPVSPNTSGQSTGGSGVIIEDNTQSSSRPAASPTTSSGSVTLAPTRTPTPTTTPSPSTSPTATPYSSPAISPPAPASSATPDEAEDYVGKPLSDLIADLGYPIRSDYEDIDEDDPTAGKIGTLYFTGFTVTTKRDSDGEYITTVTRD